MSAMHSIDVQCPQCGEAATILLPPAAETSLCRLCKYPFDVIGGEGAVALRFPGPRLSRREVLRLLDAREQEGDTDPEMLREMRQRLADLPDDAFLPEQE